MEAEAGMSTEKSDEIELPAYPFQRASEVIAALGALNEPVKAALTVLENLDRHLLDAINVMDASRGMTIKMAAQMPDLGRGLAEIAANYKESVAEYRTVRQDCFRLGESLRLVLTRLPKPDPD
jgi:hypothetical protein